MNHAIAIATKGIIGDGGVSLATKGFILLNIQQRVVTLKSGGYLKDYAEPKKANLIRVTFQYEGLVYTEIKFVDNLTHVTSQNVDIEIIDDKPKIKIIF